MPAAAVDELLTCRGWVALVLTLRLRDPPHACCQRSLIGGSAGTAFASAGGGAGSQRSEEAALAAQHVLKLHATFTIRGLSLTVGREPACLRHFAQARS